MSVSSSLKTLNLRGLFVVYCRLCFPREFRYTVNEWFRLIWAEADLLFSRKVDANLRFFLDIWLLFAAWGRDVRLQTNDLVVSPSVLCERRAAVSIARISYYYSWKNSSYGLQVSRHQPNDLHTVSWCRFSVYLFLYFFPHTQIDIFFESTSHFSCLPIVDRKIWTNTFRITGN